MSSLNLPKILIGLSVIAATVSPVLAADLPFSKTATPPAALKKPVLQKRVEAVKENMASRTAQLKAKLQTFKDQRKATVAQRLNTNLNAVNQNQTKQMQKHLNTMINILDKLESRVDRGALTAIASGRASIATASAANSAQAQNDYSIVVTSEARIKADAKTQRDKLHTDLLSLRKLVVNAKQSVANAINLAKEGTLNGQ